MPATGAWHVPGPRAWVEAGDRFLASGSVEGRAALVYHGRHMRSVTTAIPATDRG